MKKMKISLISTSHRKNSQSGRVRELVEKNLQNRVKNIKIFNLDFCEDKIPTWSPEKKEKIGFWLKKWPKISKELSTSDGFIFIVPEYGGMATPNAKNFFLICGEGELAHKPGLIISISSGNGGSYPISELRSSSYKNTHIMWIPENIIIRNVEQFNPGNHGALIPDWMDNRINYTLDLLLVYSRYMKPLKNKINRKDFGNGM